jgi:tRNA A37 threonylcarbamoyladenosine dehydratase
MWVRDVSYQDRFAGIARLYGLSALEVFQRSKVAVIGVGR